MQTFRRNNVDISPVQFNAGFSEHPDSARQREEVENQRIYILGCMFLGRFRSYRIAEVFKSRYHYGYYHFLPFLSFARGFDLFRYQDHYVIEKPCSDTSG